MSEELIGRWQDLAQACGLRDAVALGAELLERYCEPHRHYHGPEHLTRLLDLLEEWDTDRRLHLAAWFHDAIYRPGRRDNEQRSAALARKRLAATGLPASDIDFVMRAVLATAGHADSDPAFDPLLDADLAVLGTHPSAYRAYREAIRREFNRVPALLFDAARARFLRSMLDRPVIYRTALCRIRREAQARQNLNTELSHLAGRI